MLCPNCGIVIPDEAMCCKTCGRNIRPAAAETKLWTPTAALAMTRLYTGEELAQTVLSSSQAPLEERKPIVGWFVVVEGADKWKVFTLWDEEGQCSVGRGQECLVQFADPQLEDRHASIRVREGKIYVTDMDTATGTFVNGQAIIRSELQDGDTITVGATTLKFKKL